MNKVIQNATKSISNLPSILSRTLNIGKIDTNFKDLLHNRVLLYAFVIIVLLDLFYLAQMRDNTSIATLILVAFITTFFSKNMIVVLCIALVVTHVLKFGVRQVSEGFAEGADGEDEEERKEGLEDEEEPKEGLETEMKPKAKGVKGAKDDKNVPEEEKKKDFEEFQQVQDKILGGMKELDPLISKAEGFIEKYSHLMQNK